MPVLSMSEGAWERNQAMLTNGGQDMSTSRQQQHTVNTRSQDDAMVGYFFQRPQSDAELNQYTSKRWALGDDSIIEQGRPGALTVQEVERGFQDLTLGREMPPSATKKIWDEEPGKGSDGKAMFQNPWSNRDDTWPHHQQHAGPHFGRGGGEQHVSQPINMAQRRPGSFPSSAANSVLSPRSETGALGVNMVEYVLGGSPTGKDLDARLRIKGYTGQQDANIDGNTEKKSKTPSPFESGDAGPQDIDKQEVLQANGILQNGLEEDHAGYSSRNLGSRQNSPTGDDSKHHHQPQMTIDVVGQKIPIGKQDDYEGPQHIHQPVGGSSGFHLDAPQFDPVGIDPIQFDYSSQLVPSMDSPNFNVDYSQLLQRQQQQQAQPPQQQPIAVLTQQQYALATQQPQLGLNSAALTPTPYVLGNQQDAYAVGIPIAGPNMLPPQYYGVQTPWGIYPANLIQPQGQQGQQTMNQQQQLMRTQSGRPLTPSQQNENMANTATLPAPNAGYQILAPAYYDQNGQLVMGNPRGMGTPVRLVSPAPVLISANQQVGGNNLNNNTLRLLTTQPQQVQTPPVSNAGQHSGGLGGYTPSSSLGYTQVTTSLFTPISNLGQQQQSNYGNTSLSNLGSSAPGAIGTGLGMSSQRRDSLDFKQRPPLSQYYGSLGISSSPAGPMGLVQPGQSLTPPPSLSGSNSNLSLGLSGSGRLYSAAPGAEASKYRSSSMSTSMLGGSATLFPNRSLSRSASLSKEVTGRSRLLEDFRNNRIPNLQLKDLVNHVVEFSQDQHGSRFIQQKLERATPPEKSMVFNEILSAAYSLMTDVFGNYVIQKFFEFGSGDQKQTLAQRVRGHVLPLALQMYGCRVIQKALESIPAEMQVEIVKELDGHVLKCVKDQNGNHVVQKCIECVEPNHLQFIIDAFKGQVYTLSTHPYGCRVIQRILEHCMSEQTTPILDELHEHTERLVQDQYGNYVIQHVLEHGRPEDKSMIVVELRGKVLLLSQHKFASNVVEKCVSHSSRAERAMLIEEVCSMNDGPHSALYTMMKDQFANYVVQKMIDVAEPPQRKILMHKIRPHVATLRKYTYGKHILAKLEKFFLKNSSDLGPIGMPPNGTLP